MVGDLFLPLLACSNVRRRVIRLYKDAELAQWLILIFAARCRTLMQAVRQNVG
jgi:hypothetical protein